MRTLVSLCLVAAGCGTTSSTPDAGATRDLVSSSDLQEIDALMPPKATHAVFTTADFAGRTGTLATVALADRKVTKMIDATLGSDSAVRGFPGGTVLASIRPDGPLRVYDATKSFKAPVEIALGKGSNPHDAVLIPATSKAYVALYDKEAKDALAVVDLAKPQMGIVKSIALPQAAADGDKKPEANDLYLCGGFVYVTLQDLANFKPSGPGRIAVIDHQKDEVVATIQLMGPNPNGFAPVGAGCDQVLVAAAGDQFGPVDGKGGIEKVDLTSRKSLGMLLKDSDLKGHPSSVAVLSPTKAFTVLSVMGGSQTIAFDPTAAKALGDVLPKAGFVPFAAVSPDGQLFVGVQSPDMMTKMPSAGVWAGAADAASFMGTLLDLGQAPYSVSFY